MTPLERQIIEHEGFVSHAYKDSRGFLTIGYGRMVDERLGGGITLEEGLYLLRNDLAKVEHECWQTFPWFAELDDVRKRVVADMAFNLGLAKLKQFRNTLAAVEAKDWPAAAAGMRQSRWATQVGERSERLARAMETGVLPRKWW